MSKYQPQTGTKLPLEKPQSVYTATELREHPHGFGCNQDINGLPITVTAVHTSFPFLLQWLQANPWGRALPEDPQAFIPAACMPVLFPWACLHPQPSSLLLAGTSPVSGADWGQAPPISSVTNKRRDDCRELWEETWQWCWLCNKDQTQLVQEQPQRANNSVIFPKLTRCTLHITIASERWSNPHPHTVSPSTQTSDYKRVQTQSPDLHSSL